MNSKARGKEFPGSLLKQRILQGNTTPIAFLAWSPDGLTLAAGSIYGRIWLWPVDSRKFSRVIRTMESPIRCLAWSPSMDEIVVGSNHGLSFLNVESGLPNKKSFELGSPVRSLAWSSDSHLLATGSLDGKVRLYDMERSQQAKTLAVNERIFGNLSWLKGGKTLVGTTFNEVFMWDVDSDKPPHGFFFLGQRIRSLTLTRDGKTLACGSQTGTITIFEIDSSRPPHTLEGHTDSVVSLSFSWDGQLLASTSMDGTTRLWRTDTWGTTAVLASAKVSRVFPAFRHNPNAFHPNSNLLATTIAIKSVAVWELDLLSKTTIPAETKLVHYTNAKVVLVGDTGVGKSGLALVLTSKRFKATESTHGRHVWTFESQKVGVGEGIVETREALLWDLAGQPGYRLIHQLSLNEVALALVVFDARSETDPFVGVHHWVRALRQAQFTQGSSALPMKKFLVAARTDRGGVGVTQERIKALMRDHDFVAHFETSAREGKNVKELREAIRSAINWQAMPRVSSDELFQEIKAFLLNAKKGGRLLASTEDLYKKFLKSKKRTVEPSGLRAKFLTCIRLVESRGLIRHLSFGDFVLLQPELLDAYASALVNAAKDEPHGTGSISEEDARTGRFLIPKGVRLRDKEQEKMLLIATTEEMLRQEIAIREQAEDGPLLVFPSQFTRENPDLPDPPGKSVIFSFEGAVINVYTTLVVRLSHSGAFIKKELWKNAALFEAKSGGDCGVWLRLVEEGRAELALFYPQKAGDETREQFEQYVYLHLRRRALPETITRRAIIKCLECGFIVTEQLVELRRKAGFDWVDCPNCKTRIWLAVGEELFVSAPSPAIVEMERKADQKREREASRIVLQGKIASGDFDVFLCHNSVDKGNVKRIGERLKEQGILPWLDEWELRPGLPWQKLLEKQIKKIRSAAVFVGDRGIGPWQDMELAAFLRKFVKRHCPVIPVILGESKKVPKLPVFLEGMTWVDFRKSDPEPLQQLIWGITGKRSKD